MMARSDNTGSILIVDDAPANLDLLTEILMPYYQIYAATRGELALKLATSETPPDLILLDVMMPDMDGFEVIRRIKANPISEKIPVIFLSAMTSADAETRGLELGAVDYIFKPFNPPAILAKVNIHIALTTQMKFINSLLEKRIKQHARDKIDIKSQHQEIESYLTQLEEEKNRFGLALKASNTEFWDWDLVEDQVYRSHDLNLIALPNDSLTSMKDFLGCIHPNDELIVKQQIEDLVDGRRSTFEISCRLKSQQGIWVWVNGIAKVIKQSTEGQAQRIFGTITDISELKKKEQNLRIMALSLENTSDGIWIADENLVIQTVNKGYTNITGRSRDEAVGKTLQLAEVDRIEGEGFFDQVMKTLDKERKWQGELVGNGKHGKFLQELHIDKIDDQETGSSLYVGVFNDITYRKKAEEELRKLANYDSLTQLPNRTLFMERLRQAVSGKRSKHIMFAVLFIDLDNFKYVNDTFGHDIGDELLVEVSKRMVELKRPEDVVARLGGDEFTMLIDDLPESHYVARICERILREMKAPFLLGEHELIVTPSIGISLFPEDGNTITELMKNADLAMYDAKRSGKNAYAFFTDKMNKDVFNRLTMENELRKSIDNNEIILYYQPKVNLLTGELEGMEALARWFLNDKMIPPDVFIPIAEESGLIIPLGQQILFKACQQYQQWITEGFSIGKMAVNLSSYQFLVNNLILDIKDILQQTKLKACYLELEITEGAVMQDVDKAINQMQEIQNLGVSLAIDDFGTGYSSLNYLKKFPINTLKIDRSFISDMLDSKKDFELVASIVNLAHVLGLRIVAEGVETVEQALKIQSLKAEEMQGFLYSKPLPPDEFKKLMLEKTNLFDLIATSTATQGLN